jgi:prephenate dehydratase
LQKSNLKVIGEIYLQIKQNLLVNPGVRLDDIREVHSHPMAIQQCLEWLDKYNWRLVETEDTALSAKLLHQHRSKHIAAIASKLAAELFGLSMIAPNIHGDGGINLSKLQSFPYSGFRLRIPSMRIWNLTVWNNSTKSLKTLNRSRPH